MYPFVRVLVGVELQPRKKGNKIRRNPKTWKINLRAKSNIMIFLSLFLSLSFYRSFCFSSHCWIIVCQEPYFNCKCVYVWLSVLFEMNGLFFCFYKYIYRIKFYHFFFLEYLCTVRSQNTRIRGCYSFTNSKFPTSGCATKILNFSEKIFLHSTGYTNTTWWCSTE